MESSTPEKSSPNNAAPPPPTSLVTKASSPEPSSELVLARRDVQAPSTIAPPSGKNTVNTDGKDSTLKEATTESLDISTTTGSRETREPAKADMPVSRHEEPLDVEDAQDPLSHLTSIFDKIRQQVIEWGETANWKIDVFLLPNDDQSNEHGDSSSTPISSANPQPPSSLPPSKAQPPPSKSQPPAPQPQSQSQSQSLHPSGNTTADRMEFSGQRSIHETGSKDQASDRGSWGLLQPPPLHPDERRIMNMQEHDVMNMSESQAKKSLVNAIRFLRKERDLVNQYSQDLDVMLRFNARRERDADVRLATEKPMLLNVTPSQPETGKKLINQWNAERKKFEEKEIPMPQAPGAPESSSAFDLSTTARLDDPVEGQDYGQDPVEEQPHIHHRHRHVHYHRHHHRHRHLQRKRRKLESQLESESYQGLSTLAAEASPACPQANEFITDPDED
ncbi:hypothetical protein BGZ94_007722 [Podila epigama]|nr:hypothetical protein BGZ94_007722 [Podila epigama]